MIKKWSKKETKKRCKKTIKKEGVFWTYFWGGQKTTFLTFYRKLTKKRPKIFHATILFILVLKVVTFARTGHQKYSADLLNRKPKTQNSMGPKIRPPPSGLFSIKIDQKPDSTMNDLFDHFSYKFAYELVFFSHLF